jgi:hypothetical protein
VDFRLSKTPRSIFCVSGSSNLRDQFAGPMCWSANWSRIPHPNRRSSYPLEALRLALVPIRNHSVVHQRWISTRTGSHLAAPLSSPPRPRPGSRRSAPVCRVAGASRWGLSLGPLAPAFRRIVEPALSPSPPVRHAARPRRAALPSNRPSHRRTVRSAHRRRIAQGSGICPNPPAVPRSARTSRRSVRPAVSPGAREPSAHLR